MNNNQYLRRWRRVYHLSQTFRKRWVRKCLGTLHNRQKWHKICHNLKVGDPVMAMSEIIGSVNWPIRIVTEVVTQCDGFLRYITVKTSEGLFKRGVRKLCLLDGADDWGSPRFSYFVNLIIILFNHGNCVIIIQISRILCKYPFLTGNSE